MNREEIAISYRDRADNFRLTERKEERLLFYLSVARLACFSGGIILIWLGFLQNTVAGILLSASFVILFLYLLKLFSEHADKKEFLHNLVTINTNEAEALSGNISQFASGKEYENISHDFSYDVDLFGNSSLFQYLDRTVTGYGRDILAGWLSDPFLLSGDLTRRQAVIKELAGKVRWRHEFMASGMKIPLEKTNISSLLDWMKEDTFTRSSLARNVLIRVLPALAIISLFLVIAGIFHYGVFVSIFLINLFYIASGIRKTNSIHNILSKRYSYLSSLDRLLKIFDNESFDSDGLSGIKSNISGGAFSASVSVRKLGSLIQSFDSRLNILAGFVLNGLLLWDYQCIFRLDKWKSEYKKHFPVWLEMIGTVDAYVSLGNYSYNNPDFTYPVISDDKKIFSARNLGHPLISGDKRVCNDFELEKPGTVFIITGANMSGKSTFLRTVAVNYIIGMTGAPVCAGKLDFTPLKLFTSMRTTDSLSHNESYFYAELKRLKTLKIRIESGEPVFFILDEILKGTNSADKSMGSKLFLKRLIKLGATGLIATHDTSVGEMENEYPEYVHNKCFEIEIEGDRIKFDYKLNSGITQKMNAALLMKQMGILE